MTARTKISAMKAPRAPIAASVSINTGALPSAEGKDGYELARVIARWQAIAADEFPDNCKALLQMIDETDRFRLWEKNVGGFTFESRDEFLRKKVLLDLDAVEQALSEFVTRRRDSSVTPLEALKRAWNNASADEIADFLIWVEEAA